MNRETGLSPENLAEILSILRASKEIEQVFLFVSRAMGTFRRGSDVDLALVGKHVSLSEMNRLGVELNECCRLPYRFDLVNLSDMDAKPLKDRIKQVGIPLFTKS